MYFTKSTTSIRGTDDPKWWSFLRRFEQRGTAITFVIRCLNHIACHYIIIFKHQQKWCNITGIISPCEKNPSTSWQEQHLRKTNRELAGVRMSGTTVAVDWFRWYLNPFRLRGQTETHSRESKENTSENTSSIALRF